MTTQDITLTMLLLKLFGKTIFCLFIFALVGYLIVNPENILPAVTLLLIINNVRLFYKIKILEYDRDNSAKQNAEI
mgnify:FL=1